MELLTELDAATARVLIEALNVNTEETHEHGELLCERNLLDIEAERERKRLRQAELAAAHEGKTPPTPRSPRRWRKVVAASLLLLAGYTVVAKAAGAYNESRTQLNREAQSLVQQRLDDRARADAALAQMQRCMHNVVGEFLGGVKADPVCNPPAPKP